MAGSGCKMPMPMVAPGGAIKAVSSGGSRQCAFAVSDDPDPNGQHYRSRRRQRERLQMRMLDPVEPHAGRQYVTGTLTQDGMAVLRGAEDLQRRYTLSRIGELSRQRRRHRLQPGPRRDSVCDPTVEQPDVRSAGPEAEPTPRLDQMLIVDACPAPCGCLLVLDTSHERRSS